MRRNPRAKWTLPDVIDPPDRLCFQVEVPNNIYHIAAFRGALYMLSSAIFWQDDPDHTAKDVAAVWDDILQNVKACTVADTDTGITLEDFMSQQIRLKPDDPCIIQMWCVDDWQDWYDPRTCITGSVSQPEPGGDLTDGQCIEYDVTLSADEKWLLPVAVSTGDRITITGAVGGWNDGTLNWYCPSGKQYALGICGGDVSAAAGDPMQNANHMRLIGYDGTTYYDVYNTTSQVVSGRTNVQFTLQANDSSLGGNSGSISFHVKVCRPEPTTIVTITPNSHGILSKTQLEVGDEFTLSVTLGDPNYDGGFASATPCARFQLLSLSGFSAAGGWSYTKCDGTHIVLGGQPFMPNELITQWGLNSGTSWTALLKLISLT